jgi:hypothetical protein
LVKYAQEVEMKVVDMQQVDNSKFIEMLDELKQLVQDQNAPVTGMLAFVITKDDDQLTLKRFTEDMEPHKLYTMLGMEQTNLVIQLMQSGGYP